MIPRISRLAPILLVVLCLSACASWDWRVRGLRYAPGEIAVPVYSGIDAAVLQPEAYAVGSTTLEARNMDEVFRLLGEEGRKRGAHAVVLADFEAMTSRWSTWHDAGPEGREVMRQESVDVATTSATVQATGLRNPAWCVGAELVCDAPPTPGEACAVRVHRLVPGGPADAAGVAVGNRVLSVAETPANHPWDVHQWVDHVGAAGLVLGLEDARSARETRVVPIPCGDLYGA